MMAQAVMVCGLARALALAVVLGSMGASSGSSSAAVDLLGPMAFWDMQEPTGQPRVDKIRNVALRDNASKPVLRVSGGVLGPYAAAFDGQHNRLMVPRVAVPWLAAGVNNSHPNVSMVAWIRPSTAQGGSYIGGVWDEAQLWRQYALFTGLGVCPTRHAGIFHVSNVGGPTPGHQYCVTRACTGHSIPPDAWTCLAGTYDNSSMRAYLNGTLDQTSPSDSDNPFAYTGMFEPGPGRGAPFAVGANIVAEHGVPGLHNNFVGLLGGLAVYNRTISAAEVRTICAQAAAADAGPG